MQLNVIAKDSKGRPVSDLTKEDFELFDRGQRQTISYFSMQTSRLVETPAGAPAKETNLFSNRTEQQVGMPTAVTVILLDGANTGFTDLVFARRHIIQYLSQIRPDDRVALYALARGRLHVVHDFTSDASSLVRAIEGYKTPAGVQHSGSEANVTNAGIQQVDRMERDTASWAQIPPTPEMVAFERFLKDSFRNDEMTDLIPLGQALDALGAFEVIAQHVARLPGRKNLIWVSTAFPYIPSGLGDPRVSDAKEHAMRALNNANMAIYPVDPRGLMTLVFYSPNPEDVTQAAVTDARIHSIDSPFAIKLPSHLETDTMAHLAERTGGRAYYGTNDISGSIRQAVEDAKVTYALDYYPTHDEWNGEFRELKVRVKRQGVQLRFRGGYFALPDTPLTEQQKKEGLYEATYSPLDFSSLGVNIRADAVDVPGAHGLRTQVQLDAHEIQLEQRGDHWVGEIEVFFVQRDAEGKLIEMDSKQIKMDLSRETYDTLMRDGLVFNHVVSLAAPTTQLRCIVRDNASGQLGSVSVPLDTIFAAKKN